MKLSTAFRKAAEIISVPGQWRQDGSYGFEKHCLFYRDETLAVDTGSYCMIGAAAKAANAAYVGGLHLEEVASSVAWGSVLSFNDSPNTTQDDVVMLSLFIAEALKSEGL